MASQMAISRPQPRTAPASPTAAAIDRDDARTGPGGCISNRLSRSTSMQYSDDWSEITLSLLQFGDSNDGPINLDPTPDLTTEQMQAQSAALVATDLDLQMALDPA